jgi:hypothetical protein
MSELEQEMCFGCSKVKNIRRNIELKGCKNRTIFEYSKLIQNLVFHDGSNFKNM